MKTEYIKLQEIKCKIKMLINNLDYEIIQNICEIKSSHTNMSVCFYLEKSYDLLLGNYSINEICKKIIEL